MHTTIVCIKCIGMSYGLPQWIRGKCQDDISAKLFIRGSMPSAHIATIAFFSVTLLYEFPLVGIALTLLQASVQLKQNCHTPLQVFAGIVYGLVFGILTVYINKKYLHIQPF